MKLGVMGEQWATLYLEKKGYKIIENNYRCEYGEIDIIANKNEVLIFIEVKTRANLNYGLPCESITKNKKLHFHKTAQYFICERKNLKRFNGFHKRIDVVEILFIEGKRYIRHIENAF